MSKSFSHEFPYLCGKEVTLILANGCSTTAKIVDVKTRTLSCVMTVQFPSSPKTCILKIYDRRYAEQLRRDEGAVAWDLHLEHRYRDFVRNSGPSKLFERWSSGFRTDHYYADEQRELWSQEVLELYLQFLCLQAYETETHAYKLLGDLQGVHVPVLYGSVIMGHPEKQSIDNDTDNSSHYLRCPGIILQHIEGFPLTDLATKSRPEHWQEICDRAINVVHQIGDRGICNKDVKTRSFIVCNASNYESYQVFMIDFGSCVFREQASSDREFREWQADQDEEGAIGCVMERRLKGGYKYRRSNRGERLLCEFKSED